MRTIQTVISLILGLVFQLSQVVPVAAAVTTSCPTVSASCGCCEGPRSCHCADTSESDQKPAPAPLDTSGTLKIPAMRSADTRVSLDSFRETEPSATVVQGTPHSGMLVGFTGVRLSVAFCSFVI